LAAPDPTVGNRLTGCPVIQKRLADVDTCITQVGHSILLDVVFQSFNATGNFVTLRLKTPISASSIEAGEAFCLSRSIPGDSVFTGLGAKQYDLSGTIEEWSGAVTSFNGLTIVIQLSATPTTPGNLSEVTCIAPNNQKMWIVPLGRVVSNADNYTATPVALNVPEWTYMDKTTNTIGPFTCISPKINTVYAAIGDMLKYFIIIERSPGFQPYDNGFKIIPTLIVY
jgi:hypothetical protein